MPPPGRRRSGNPLRRASERKANHPSPAKPPRGPCHRRGRGSCSPYLAGFVKLLLEPRHRHLPRRRGGGGAAQARRVAGGPGGVPGRSRGGVPAGPGRSPRPPRPLAVSPAPTATAAPPRAQANIASPAGPADATPLAAAGAHANDRAGAARPLATCGGYANESAAAAPAAVSHGDSGEGAGERRGRREGACGRGGTAATAKGILPPARHLPKHRKAHL